MVTNEKLAFQFIKVLFSVPLSSPLVQKGSEHARHSPYSVNSSLLSRYFQMSCGWPNSLVTEASYNCRWMWVDAMTSNLIGTSCMYQKLYHCKMSGALEFGISWRGWAGEAQGRRKLGRVWELQFWIWVNFISNSFLRISSWVPFSALLPSWHDDNSFIPQIPYQWDTERILTHPWYRSFTAKR